MGFTRQRKESKFIIKSKRNVFVNTITTLLTVIMWIYSLTIVYFFVSGIFNHNDYYISAIKITLRVTNKDIQNFVLISVILFLVSFTSLLLWKIYNKNRYGKLNRRSEPLPSTDEDILNLNLMQSADYYYLKNNKRAVFYSNPIKELYKEEVT